MSSARSGNLGATRVCPHCKATVLENSAVCPGCRHHLRFNTGSSAHTVAEDGYCALDVDGTIRHKVASEPCEYCVVLDVRNERGEQVVRQVVGVGVLQAGEVRRLHVAVDMLPVRAPVAAPPPAAKLPHVPQPSVAASPPSAKSFLKPPVPGQGQGQGKPAPAAAAKTSAPGAAAPSGSLFRSFRKP
jgi:hypothetical protein